MMRELLGNGARARSLRCLLVAILCVAPISARADAPKAAGAEPGADEIQVLFVQSSTGVVADTAGRTLTLTGMNPETLFFADRPARDTGHLATEEFLKLWVEGENSFRVHPPNATLSVLLEGRERPSNIVVTLQNPRRKGGDLVYDYILLEGQMPARGGPSSLFIDILGVRRRCIRRTAVVVGGTEAVAASSAAAANAAAQQQAAAQEKAAQAASAQSAAAAQQAAAAANQAAAAANAAAHPAAPPKTPQQQLEELKSLYDKGLISESDYNAAKAKILAQIE